MAIRTIRQYPDPALRKPAESVAKVTKEIKKLIHDLFATMRAAHGVGLAAPQLGISKRVIVVDISEREDGKPAQVALVNPTIVREEGETEGEEGCLSFPSELKVTIRRFAKVKVKGLGPHGRPVQVTAEGLLSRVLQHEVDHLNGILFIDRMSFSQKLKMQQVLDALNGKELARR